MYCGYLKKEIDEGLCYDIQLISGGYILPSALPDVKIDKALAKATCGVCSGGLKACDDNSEKLKTLRKDM